MGVHVYVTIIFSFVVFGFSGQILAQTSPPINPSSTTTEGATSPSSRWSSFYQYQHRSLLNSQAQIDKDMVPETLTLRTHLLAVDYSLADGWSVEAGVQYLDMDISLLGNGLAIDAGSRGLSDTELGLVKRFADPQSQLKTRVAISVPTGSIRQKDSTTINMGRRGNVTVERILPYQGQLGSGTYDIIGEVDHKTTFLSQWVWRNKLKYVGRTGRNDLNYRLGNEGKWISEFNAPVYGKYLTAMVGGTYKRWGAVTGPNPVLEEMKKSMPFPVELEDLYAKPGERLETYAALKTGFPMASAGILAVELGRPLTSYVSGNETELKTDWYSYISFISTL